MAQKMTMCSFQATTIKYTVCQEYTKYVSFFNSPQLLDIDPWSGTKEVRLPDFIRRIQKSQ